MRLDLGDHTQALAFMLRDYAPETTAYISDRLPEGGTFFDVGGNVGLVSFALAAVRPDANIHAFEPNSVNAAAWCHNRQLNDAGYARLTEAAVSAREGEANFAIPSDSGSGMLHVSGTQKVPTISLDQYCAAQRIAHIDVLKIDVQGHEPSVIGGANGMLTAGAVSTIICEICEPLLGLAGHDRAAIIAPLENCGFRATTLPESGLRRFLPGRPRRYYADLAFER